MRNPVLLGAACGALLLAASASVRAQATAPDAAPKETKAQFDARTKWWREARFGMFIHWGIYSIPADGEWHMNTHKMQVKDYEPFAAQFNPVNFDARRWVQIAKDAGMKYIVITSKHHDGFCMFDTKLSDYNVVKATPWRHDPMKDLAAECKRQGIRLCFYHSVMDWHHPDYLPRREWETTTRPADGASLDRYIEHMKGQLRELLTNYGPIGVIWFDGGWEHTAQELHSADVNAMIRSIQPNILINDRNQLPEDFSTPEQTIPSGAMPAGRLWETCMTLNNNWGYAREDHNWKSTEDLVRKLCDIASKGGNFLLNVGPSELGEIPEPSVERLGQVGAWMKVNGASIYGTTASPYRKPVFDGRITTKRNTLYLQVFHWPEGALALPGLKTRVLGARALDGGERLAVSAAADGTGVEIAKPRKLDPYATVVELKLEGAPGVEDVATVIKPGADGVFTLRAADAQIHGDKARYEEGGGRDNIGYWVDAADYVSWTCDVPTAGRYKVMVTYACDPGSDGATYTVGAQGGRSVAGNVASTGSWTTFTEVTVSELPLAAGKQAIEVRAKQMPRGAVMNLKQIRLEPVK